MERVVALKWVVTKPVLLWKHLCFLESWLVGMTQAHTQMWAYCEATRFCLSVLHL